MTPQRLKEILERYPDRWAKLSETTLAQDLRNMNERFLADIVDKQQHFSVNDLQGFVENAAILFPDAVIYGR